jgi:hypothetical protein
LQWYPDLEVVELSLHLNVRLRFLNFTNSLPSFKILLGNLNLLHFLLGQFFNSLELGQSLPICPADLIHGQATVRSDVKVHPLDQTLFRDEFTLDLPRTDPFEYFFEVRELH